MKILPPPPIQFSPGDATGATDQSSSLAAAAAQAAAAGADLVLPNGAIIGLSSPFVLPAGVGMDFNGATLKALTGLSGGVIQLGATGGSAFTYSSGGGVRNIKIDCNEVTAAKGIDIVDARRVTIDNPHIWKCVTHGIAIAPGCYQIKVTNFEIIASSPHASTGGTTLAADAARGIYCAASDNDFISGACQHFYAGVEATGGNNQFEAVKCWSSYYDVDTKMHFGFIVSGAANSFINCTADSVRTIDNSTAPSTSNGGIGFYVADGAERTHLCGCAIIVSSAGDTAPQATSLLAVYIGDDYFTMPGGIRMRDIAGGKIKTPTIQAASDTFLFEAEYGTGGGLNAYLTDKERAFLAGREGRWYRVEGGVTADAHTGDTSETVLRTVALAAGIMGNKGDLRTDAVFSLTSSANNKTVRVKHGASGAGLTGNNIFSQGSITTSASVADVDRIVSNSAAAAQVARNTGSQSGATSGAKYTGSINTAVATEVAFTGICGAAGETVTLERYSVDVLARVV